jgi:two-component system, cell cycle sensor histidine kinase and response regulator CckA
MGARADKETILVVDDEEVFRLLCTRFLERHGYEVLTADSPSGVEAIWEKHGARVDLLLLDVCLSEALDGFDLARALQARKPGLKVVFMSGYQWQNLSRAPEPKMFLQKPFEGSQLTETIRNCMDFPGT